MDIRQIQALHAQYASEPIVIDITGHVKPTLALPAPEVRRAGRIGVPATRALRRIGRPALIVVAVAAIAAGMGMSAAKLWTSLHSGLAHPLSSTSATFAERAVVPVPAGHDMEINAAPAQPLTASDLGLPDTRPQSALGNVDAHTLINSAALPNARQTTTGSPAPNELARAAASPIHAIRPATESSAAVVATPLTIAAVASATVSVAPEPAKDTTSARAVAEPAQPATASAATANARPPLRPIRHITPHRARDTAGSGEHSVPQEQTPSTSSASRPAATGKSGDVQLF